MSDEQDFKQEIRQDIKEINKTINENAVLLSNLTGKYDVTIERIATLVEGKFKATNIVVKNIKEDLDETRKKVKNNEMSISKIKQVPGNVAIKLWLGVVSILAAGPTIFNFIKDRIPWKDILGK